MIKQVNLYFSQETYKKADVYYRPAKTSPMGNKLNIYCVNIVFVSLQYNTIDLINKLWFQTFSSSSYGKHIYL